MIRANQPERKTWLTVPTNSDFPLQNIPFGIAKYGNTHTMVTRIGDHVVNLAALAKVINFDIDPRVFSQNCLNAFIKLGKATTRRVRDLISDAFLFDNPLVQNHQDRNQIIIDLADVEMVMPVKVGDYTDFYSSKEHATNVGTMFRDPANALLPNWLHLPVAYHGRASSIVVSGTPIHRPKGQTRPNDNEPPLFGPTRLLDFELELAFVTYDGKALGHQISTQEADDFIFGLCLFNDWSARDIQKWEYVPLGPFLAKNFASSISPWIVTLDALEPFRVPGPTQEPEVLPYLKCSGDNNLDIELEVAIIPPNGEAQTVCHSNFKYMYWNMEQQLAHHTVGGCNINAGDMMASGTISGSDPSSYGSMLEITWRGTKPVAMANGSDRKFILDGDTVVMRGHCQKKGIRVGFGELSTLVKPALE